MLIIKRNTTLVDTVTAAYGTVEALFSLALQNGLGITDEPAAGTALVPVNKKYFVTPVTFPAPAVPVPIKAIVKKQQTFLDYTTQYTGSVEGWFAIAQANDRSITDKTVAPGSVMITPVIDMDIVAFFDAIEIDITSGLDDPGTFVPPGGIGYMQILRNFIVS